MKRMLSVLAALLLLPLPKMAAEPLRDNDLKIAAPYAVLMEKETGEILYEKGADERTVPASVTKVMTLLLIVEDIENGKLALDDVVTASARAASFGGSCVYPALGMDGTHFTNCTGLFDDDDHYTTARDVAVMSRELVRHELLKRYSTIWMDTIRGGNFSLSNTNKLVYWYPGCTGLKTGFTSKAMYCLAATAERDGVEFIAVIMHGDTIESRNADAKALLNYAFANFTLTPLPEESELPAVPVVYGREESAALRYGGEDRYILSPKGGESCRFSYVLPEELPAPVHAGDAAGTLVVTRGDEELSRLPLSAARDVGRIGIGGIFLKLAGSLFGL